MCKSQLKPMKISFAEFDGKNNVSRYVWIPGKENMDDPGTKSDSPLTDALHVKLLDDPFSL